MVALIGHAGKAAGPTLRGRARFLKTTIWPGRPPSRSSARRRSAMLAADEELAHHVGAQAAAHFAPPEGDFRLGRTAPEQLAVQRLRERLVRAAGLRVELLGRQPREAVPLAGRTESFV